MNLNAGVEDLAAPILRDPPLDYEDWMRGYYHNHFYCSNCMNRNHKMIRRGVRAETQKIDCEKCGCEVKG